MQSFDAQNLIAGLDRSGHQYKEFLREETLSLGLAIWHVGEEDLQKPHAEDEVYYIVSGRGAIAVGEENQPVGPGSIIFVAAGVEHHFHSIEEDLQVIVFWAPPHHSRET